METFLPLIKEGISIFSEVVVSIGLLAAFGFFKKKFGIEISDEKKKKLKEIAIDAVLQIEEESLRDTPFNSAAKRKKAILKVISENNVGEEIAEQLVDWAVAVTPGIGATGKKLTQQLPV